VKSKTKLRIKRWIGAIRYSKLSSCRSFSAWFYHQWWFANRYGVREYGTRFCGIETVDWLDSWAPLLYKSRCDANKRYHECNCGGIKFRHSVGDKGCYRQMEAAPIKVGENLWKVNGRTVTDWVLRNQRGYHQHNCGCWSSHGDSNTSLDVV